MTIKIPLSQGKVALIDGLDWGVVRKYTWYAQRQGDRFYAVAKVLREDGKREAIMMHRLLLNLSDRSILTNHIDGDGLNNTRANLRTCTATENRHNSRNRSDNTSGLKGVTRDCGTGKWKARIKRDGRTKNLGLFASREEAHAAYCQAATKLYGQFANFGG